MSTDHKADDPTEKDRIKSSGGIVLDNRVGGSLAVTRAFGDHSLKNSGLIVTPFINKHVMRPFD
jgi:serine/threonine protein phosphatase PrpC